MLAGFSVFADDLYVNSSGLEGTYYTIQEAVDAASDGDNIYISTVGVFGEDVTITKSLYLIASIPEEEWTMAGDILISDPGYKIEVTIIGLANGSVNTLNSSYTSSVVNVISSTLTYFNSGNGWIGNVYNCLIENNISIDNGHIKSNIFNGSLTVGSDMYNVLTDTVQIIANKFNSSSVTFGNDEHYMMICNNYFTTGRMTITDYRDLSGGTNLISNNTIFYYNNSGTSYASIYINNSPYDGQNVIIANNYSASNNVGIYASSGMENAYIANNYSYSGIYGFDNSLTYDNSSNSGINYNSQTGVVSTLNTGLDWIEFRDIDNTINDVGTGGGPHAWSNYHPTQGKAAIVDLELPHQLYIGGVHSVKAKSIHKN